MRARQYLKTIEAAADALMRALGMARAELSLTVVTDRAIRRLNREFRGQDRPTDVLSFPQFDPDSAPVPAAFVGAAPVTLGDIVISVETAARQARELGVSVEARMCTLLIHGMLHLLGYDHERSAAAARRMFAREHQLAALLAGGASAKSASAAKRGWSPAAMPPRRRARQSDAPSRRRAGLSAP